MRLHHAILLFACIFSSHVAYSQPNWREIVSPAFLVLIEEANDSIAQRRAEATSLRKEMNAIITAKNLDRDMIAGSDGRYMAEGMHKHFKKPPERMQGQFERDQQIVRLENLHVQLYQSDLALFRWIDILAKLRNHPDLALHSRWARQWSELPEKERPNAQSLSDCRKWVTNELVCEFAGGMQKSSSDQRPGKLRSTFDPAILAQVEKVRNDKIVAYKLPFPPEAVAASYPANGQFAFHRSESIPGVGYVIFMHGVAPQLGELASRPMLLKARWTSAKGGAVVYTHAESSFYNEKISFNLPDTLFPEMVYRLELLAVPQGPYTPKQPVQECWRIFRGKPAPEISGKELALPGEELITELFFRTGKYDVFQKPKTLRGRLNWASGTLHYLSDEPFDETEFFGNHNIPPSVTIEIQDLSFYKISSALRSQTVFYYLTVPKIEPLENVPPEQLVAAERDHTLDAPFVRKITLGNPDGYKKVFDNDKYTILPGKYVAPPYKTLGIKDSLVTAQPLPFITRDDFKKRKSMPFPPTECTLYIGEIQQLMNAATIQQEQLRRRVNERARFFYELEKRRALREKQPFTATLDQFLEEEKKNMPEEVKLLLESTFPDVLKNDFTIFISRSFPGTQQRFAQLPLKIDAQE